MRTVISLLGNNESKINHGVCGENDQLLLVGLIDSGIFGVLSASNCSGRVLSRRYSSRLDQHEACICVKTYLGTNTDT